MVGRSIRLVLERAHLDAAGDEDVLPLRPDLYPEAVSRLGAARVRDLGDFVRLRAMTHAGLQAVRGAGRLALRARAQPCDMWREGLGVFEVNRALHLGNVMAALLAALRPHYALILVPASLRGGDAWRTWAESHVLIALRAAALAQTAGLQFYAGVHQEPSRIRAAGAAVAWRGKVALGRLVEGLALRMPQLFFAGRRNVLPGCRILLAGLQATDAILQGAFAESLRARWGHAFLWLRLRKEERLAEDEQLLAARAGSGNTVDRQAYPSWTWRSWRPRMWVACRCVDWVERVVGSDAQVVGRGLRHLLLEMLRPHALSEFVEWRHRLAPAGVRIVIGNSFLGEMSSFVAAARAGGARYLLTPHGGGSGDLSNFYHLMSGDYALFTGRVLADLAARTHCYPRPREQGVIGNFFMGLAAGGPAAARSGSADDLLFLENSDYTLPTHLTAGALWRWLQDVGGAAQAGGCRLLLRPHPRMRTADYYATVARALVAEGGRAEVDTRSDLWSRLGEVCAVVVPGFDTAVLKAIMAGVPVLFYVRGCAWHPLDRFARKVSPVLRTPRDLGDAVRRLRSDAGYAADLRGRQAAFLEAYLDQQPPAPAERLGDFVAAIEREVFA